MSKDWEKLAGEKGERVPTGRLSRTLRLGAMGARVATSSLMSKVGTRLLPGGQERREEALSRALEKNAARAVEVLGQLKGASMKIGQLLSADPEMLPPEFASQLSSLQRDAPPMKYTTVKAQIEEALDRPLEVVFSYFDPEPIGAASLGQVHRARLVDGRDVAVKVQYPGVAESFESDLKTLKGFLIYARAVVDKERLEAYLAEIRRIMEDELDYRKEAANLERFQEILKEQEHTRSPAPIMEWCRETVLVMEFMEGEKLDEALEKMEDGPRRQRILKQWVELFSWMFHEKFALHADPHPGNFLLGEGDELILLDFGCVKDFDPEFTDGFLDILDAYWQDDGARAVEGYLKLGFGAEKHEAKDFDLELMAEYSAILLAPFMTDESFDFGSWEPAREGKLFMLRHPSLFRLVPPPDALAYLRVLSGIKGLLAKMDAKVEVASMAVETARRRGRLTGEPVIF